VIIILESNKIRVVPNIDTFDIGHAFDLNYIDYVHRQQLYNHARYTKFDLIFGFQDTYLLLSFSVGEHSYGTVSDTNSIPNM